MQQRRSADSTDPIASALTRRFGIFGGLGWAAILTGGVLSEQIKTRIEDAREAKETVTVTSGTALAAEREIGRGVRARDVRIGGGAPVAKGLLLVLNVKARTIDKSESSGSSGSGGSSSSGSGRGSGSGGESRSSSSPPDSSSSSHFGNSNEERNSNEESNSNEERYFIDTSAPGAKPLVLLFGTKLSGGICPGAELALVGMRAGGRRVVVVPPEAGFGGNGYTSRPTAHVPEKRGEVPPGATLEYDIEVVRVSVPPS